MDKKWKKVKTEQILGTDWFNFEKDSLITPSGKKLDYYVIRKPVCGIAVPFNGVKFYLVKIFRPSIFSYSWEFPMGTTKDDEGEVVVKQEMKEETGFTAQTWTYLGRFLFAPGMVDQAGVVYLAEGLKAGQPEREDAEEDMKVGSFSLKEIEQMIYKGEIFDGATISSVYFLKQYLSNKKNG